ncbi:MAG: DUF2283 domain-containing protein [Thermoanaerobaculia bacterium]|nr:DUF2283 domain-containing protein [Thermoanaerobaculia bacterium]
MNAPYLEVTYRKGRPFAGYLYLPRNQGDRSCRTKRVEPGMVVDFNQDGRPIGIEMTAPALVTDSVLNQLLQSLEIEPLEAAELAPLRAA